MTTPPPSNQKIAEELSSVLRSEAERVTPEPALHRILTRAHEAGPTKSIRRRGGGWLPVIGGVVATAGLAAAAIVIFAPDDQKTATEPSVSCGIEVREGCPVDLAVYRLNSGTTALFSTDVTVESSGNVGLDAVQALLDAKSVGPVVNPWHGYNAVRPDTGPIAEVNDVTQADDFITVDFDRPLMTDLASFEGDPRFGKLLIQQLVLTVQSALRTESPVMITVDGEPADEAFGVPLAIPGTDAFEAQFARWTWVEGIRRESPTQGEVMRSPVTISGTASTFEGTVVLSITQDGRQVRHGVDTAGTQGMYQPYRFTVNLPPGDYTLKLWEPNQASGAEAWADELWVVYTDFTVE
jgi:Immunoglobulin-like domain of bacterial spore germination/Sporulation and spore germination